jgi:hypothetical protein
MRDVPRRSRLAYAGAALLIAWIGFGARWLPYRIPDEVAANTFDVLGALTAFLAVGVLFPTAATWQTSCLAFSASAALGACQHWYPVPWIEAAYHTPLGALLLAHATTPLNLGCRAAGIGLGMVAEWVVLDT